MASLKALKGTLTALSLGLNKPRLTDADLTFLSDMTQLEELDLNGTAMTDAGLKFLSGLKNLKTLSLKNTAVDDEWYPAIARAFSDGSTGSGCYEK